MQRNPGFPVANCSLQMPDSLSLSKLTCEDTAVHHQMRQQLINFGHAQWGFNNWSWTVTKQELDFVDMSNEKYIAGVVAYVSISIKNIDIRRENIGYATSLGNNKGYAIFISRKMAVTNALRETLLSFGGTVASELTELLEGNVITEPLPENNQNLANINLANSNHANANPSLANTNLPSKLVKPLLEGPPLIKPSLDGPPLVKNVRKDTVDTAPANIPPAPVKNAPIAKTLSMPANAPRLPTPRSVPAPQPVLQPALHARPNSNEPKLEGMNEEARAERKRRQRLAQEEFRQKQLAKQDPIDEKHESLDKLLMEIPTQDIVIEETGASNKRKSPNSGVSAKRRTSISKLDILHD